MIFVYPYITQFVVLDPSFIILWQIQAERRQLVDQDSAVSSWVMDYCDTMLFYLELVFKDINCVTMLFYLELVFKDINCDTMLFYLELVFKDINGSGHC